MIIIGHRGAKGLQPENTLLSFKEALKYVQAVELDVYVCKTGELVVIHDETVNRTTNKKGYVENLTLKELKTLDAGRGEKIPTLNEVLDLINNSAIVNIELKGKGTTFPVSKMIKTYIGKGWKKENFLVSSFDFQELKNFFKLCPQIKLGVLIEKIEKEVDYISLAKEVNAFSINPPFAGITKEFVDQMHKVNLKVFVWTVNTKESAQKLKKLGADGFVTDYPNKAFFN
ncbi:MAG: glycerophosphodiester phosphodiesterase family protein [Candidatus Paceibacterota bacterium]